MKFVLFLFLMLFSVTASAGDEMSLCDKVNMATDIVEMEFKNQAKYPTSLQQKQYPPKNEELQKIAATGKVTHVFKGSLNKGAPWVNDMPSPFWGVSSVEKYKKIFEHDQFRRFLFLYKAQAGYNPVGGVEETHFCEKSAHYSWCLGYSNYIASIKQCLANSK